MCIYSYNIAKKDAILIVLAKTSAISIESDNLLSLSPTSHQASAAQPVLRLFSAGHNEEEETEEISDEIAGEVVPQDLFFSGIDLC